MGVGFLYDVDGVGWGKTDLLAEELSVLRTAVEVAEQGSIQEKNRGSGYEVESVYIFIIVLYWGHLSSAC